jgi:hypothetical protein
VDHAWFLSAASINTTGSRYWTPKLAVDELEVEKEPRSAERFMNGFATIVPHARAVAPSCVPAGRRTAAQRRTVPWRPLAASEYQG